MKKNLLKLLTGLFAVAVILSLPGCSDDDNGGNATITIEEISKTDSTITVEFRPSANTSQYRYAIGKEFNEAAFMSGELAGMRRQQDNQSIQYTFPNLSEETEYIVFALAFDGKNNPGQLTKKNVITDHFRDSKERVRFDEQNPITYRSDWMIGVSYKMIDNRDFTAIYTAIGTKEDSLDFVNGNLATMYQIPFTTIDWTASFFDLEPDTDYVVYFKFQHTDASRLRDQVRAFPTRTMSTAEAPRIEVEIVENTVGWTKVKLTPNEKVGSYVGFMSEPGMYESFRGNSYMNGDIVLGTFILFDTGYPGVLLQGVDERTWVSNFYAREDVNPAEYSTVYAGFMDPSGNLAGVTKPVIVSPPAKDASLGTAVMSDVSIVQEELTFNSVTSRYSPGANTLAFFYGLITESLYDTYMQRMQDRNDYTLLPELIYTEAYVEGTMYMSFLEGDYANVTVNNNVWTLVDGEEEGVERSTSYVAVAAPLNANGRSGGWGTLSSAPVTTPASSVAAQVQKARTNNYGIYSYGNRVHKRLDYDAVK